MARTKNWQRYLDDPEYGIEISENEKMIMSNSVSLQETELDEEQLAQIYPTLVMEDPLEAAMRSNIEELVSEALSLLRPIHKKVLEIRYRLDENGMIDDEDLRSYTSMGQAFEFSITYARVLETKALRKLLHPDLFAPLRALL